MRCYFGWLETIKDLLKLDVFEQCFYCGGIYAESNHEIMFCAN